jgi:hypothetical protein
MASKFEEVLEIEVAGSYIKRLAGPMITLELRDFSKLVGYIRIPSMAEGAATNDTVVQRILYSDLSNQCRKCRRFGHHARACNIVKTKPWEGASHPRNPPPKRERRLRAEHQRAITKLHPNRQAKPPFASSE